MPDRCRLHVETFLTVPPGWRHCCAWRRCGPMLFDAGDRMWRCVLFPQTSGQQILEQERVSDARGSLRGHGARRSTDVGCSCWRGPLQAEVTVPGDVLGWTPGGVHRRGPVGIGKPGSGALGSLLVGVSLPPRGMSRSTNRPVEGLVRWGFPPRACGEASGVVSSGRFLTPRGWWGLLRAGAVGVVTFLNTNF